MIKYFMVDWYEGYSVGGNFEAALRDLSGSIEASYDGPGKREQKFAFTCFLEGRVKELNIPSHQKAVLGTVSRLWDLVYPGSYYRDIRADLLGFLFDRERRDDGLRTALLQLTRFFDEHFKDKEIEDSAGFAILAYTYVVFGTTKEEISHILQELAPNWVAKISQINFELNDFKDLSRIFMYLLGDFRGRHIDSLGMPIYL